jgi:hypothetical protein
MKGEGKEKNEMEGLSIEIDAFQYVFLESIEEVETNNLRLVVVEGIVCPETVSRDVGGAHFEGHPVKPAVQGGRFEITWEHYVAYSVRNELYAKDGDNEKLLSGKRIAEFSKSDFLDYISHATFATEEYPGPLRHVEVACENHIVDVVAVAAPKIRSLSPKIRPI